MDLFHISELRYSSGREPLVLLVCNKRQVRTVPQAVPAFCGNVFGIAMANAKRLLLVLLVLTAAGAGASGAGNADGAWKNAGADDGLRKAFERARYSLEDAGHGTWRGVNAAQRLTLEFSGNGARLSHPDGSVDFHLNEYGYGDRLREPADAKPTANGNRVEYQRGDLTEWYLNGAKGLEQGFTLAKRP